MTTSTTQSTRQSTERDHTLEVWARITEDQWRHLHAVCGEGHPGRFKEWAGHFLFSPRTTAQYHAAVDWASGQGLTFRGVTTTTDSYAPKET